MKGLLLFCLGIVFVPVVVLVVAAFGWVSVATTNSLGPVDTFLDFSSSRSVAHHATEMKLEDAGDAKLIETGLDHYRENCVICHGAPGLDDTEIAQGMKPEPPNLASEDSQSLSDGEIDWIVTNGIQMTGMPGFGKTHTKEQVRAIVAFVRHLPKITAKERKELARGPGAMKTGPKEGK